MTGSSLLRPHRAQDSDLQRIENVLQAAGWVHERERKLPRQSSRGVR